MKVVHIGHVPLPSGHPDYGRLYSHPGRWVPNLAMAQAAIRWQMVADAKPQPV